MCNISMKIQGSHLFFLGPDLALRTYSYSYTTNPWLTLYRCGILVCRRGVLTLQEATAGTQHLGGLCRSGTRLGIAHMYSSGAIGVQQTTHCCNLPYRTLVWHWMQTALGVTQQQCGWHRVSTTCSLSCKHQEKAVSITVLARMTPVCRHSQHVATVMQRSTAASYQRLAEAGHRPKQDMTT